MIETAQGIAIREAGAHDLAFMEQMAQQAIFCAADVPADACQHQSVRWFIDGWGQPRDFGCIALDTLDNQVGAAWARQLRCGEGVPLLPVAELIIAVEPGSRSRGVGAQLIESLCERGRHLGLETLVLVVGASSPAQRLYRRCGFHVLEGANEGRQWADPDDPELVMVRAL